MDVIPGGHKDLRLTKMGFDNWETQLNRVQLRTVRGKVNDFDPLFITQLIDPATFVNLSIIADQDAVDCWIWIHPGKQMPFKKMLKVFVTYSVFKDISRYHPIHRDGRDQAVLNRVIVMLIIVCRLPLGRSGMGPKQVPTANHSFISKDKELCRDWGHSF